MPKQTAAKGWAAALSVLILYALGRITGTIEMPPIEAVGQALTDLGAALVSAAVGYAITWLGPRNKDKLR